ncbi:serine protease inhibitor 28Dc-like [Ochlerotatus camptorhynchus]|uniref:serine protease inhibitor 28Dc-like n=1 Tax=Ochlerotatus camptorhynchus TaxID=644619 RepID=UPI0031DF1D65
MRKTIVIPFAALLCYCVVNQATAQSWLQSGSFAPLYRTTPSPVARARVPTTINFSNRRSQLSVDLDSSVRNIDTANDEQLSRAVVELALQIGRISADSNSPAEVFSPVSIMGVLNMLLMGSNGLTRAELFGALNLNEKTDYKQYHRRAGAMMRNLLSKTPKQLDLLGWKTNTCNTYDYDYEDNEPQPPATPKVNILNIANAIFVQNNLPINPKYESAAMEIYGATTQKIDFRNAPVAISTINNWANQATFGKIREILSGSFSTDTSMVIASSLYFKATWQNEFIPKITRPKDFYPDGQDRPTIKVDMMSMIQCLPYLYEKSLGFKMIGLPYSDNATTMYVMMPVNSSRVKIRELQNRLTAGQIDSMITKMKLRTTTLTFPRTQLESSTNLEKSFRKLGVKSIFNVQSSDLGMMLNQNARGKTRLFVSQISHKVNLSVDENGTEGAAVTMTLIDRSASSVYFNVNQPFLVYVRHDPTRLPLFYGAVFDPRG